MTDVSNKLGTFLIGKLGICISYLQCLAVCLKRNRSVTVSSEKQRQTVKTAYFTPYSRFLAKSPLVAVVIIMAAKKSGEVV